MNFSPRKIEEIISTDTQIDPVIEAVMQAYEQQKQTIEKILESGSHSQLYDHITTPRILNSQQITELTLPLDKLSGVYFLNKILQTSYNAGHNNFTIYTKDNLPNHIGAYLQGTPKKPITLTIQGNHRHNLARYGKYLNVTVEGNNGHYLGSYSRQTNITIIGGNGDNLGYESHQLTTVIIGNNGEFLGDHSDYLTATINGNNGSDLGYASNKLIATIQGDNQNNLGIYSENLKATIQGNNGIITSDRYNIIKNAHITLHGTTTVGNFANIYTSIFHTKCQDTYNKLKAAGATVEMIT